jgi:hypothetical protein
MSQRGKLPLQVTKAVHEEWWDNSPWFVPRYVWSYKLSEVNCDRRLEKARTGFRSIVMMDEWDSRGPSSRAGWYSKHGR